MLEEYMNKKEDTEIKHETVIQHTKIERLIYNEKKQKIDELYSGMDYTIESIENKGSEKLSSFKNLPQDLFNLFYKINPENRDENNMTENTVRYNKKIIEKLRENSDYSALKLLTEGKDYESIESTREFVKDLYDNIDDYIKESTGDKGVPNQIEKLERTVKEKERQLISQLENLNILTNSGASKKEIGDAEKKVMFLANQVDGVKKKIEEYDKLIQSNSFANKDNIERRIDGALQKAIEKVNEITDIIDSFGTLDGQPKTIEGKTNLIDRVRGNNKFKEMSKFIGRLRRMAKQSINKSYTQGRGEKVGIEFGNNITKALPSELVLLATPETELLFYKKVADKKLKQYKERTQISQGRGHIIVCRDESSSTSGGKEYWAKAISIALMDVAVKSHRNYVDIPFSANIGAVTEVTENIYNEELMMGIATNFMGGGTEFTQPIEKSMEFISTDLYSKADIVFITDGESSIDEEVLKKFLELKNQKKTKVFGIILDKGGYERVSDVEIKRFCDVIYKTSELSESEIEHSIINSVI
jgi:hypothetical protein